MSETHADGPVRSAAFAWLASIADVHGDTFPRAVLSRGFLFRGDQIRLVGPQGIFKPALLDLPLSITTAYDGPYDDTWPSDDFLHYRYRGTDPLHRDNVGLRRAMVARAPLVYFSGVGHGRYGAVWPVLIVHDDPHNLTFTVAAEDEHIVWQLPPHVAEADLERRRYLTVAIRRRLHQQTFRERVLVAYQEQCAVCRLRHRELLDGAHILEDRDGGQPVVPNGMALCKLHHAAFDSNVLGINPDVLTVEIRNDVLEEVDGPMLVNGLQALHRQPLCLPARLVDQPDRRHLTRRYERFLAA